MDVVVAAAEVGGNGYFWVHYLTPAAGVGEGREVVGAAAVSVVEVSVAEAEDSAAVLVAVAASVAAVPAAAGRCCPSYSESVNSVSIRDTQTKRWLLQLYTTRCRV